MKDESTSPQDSLNAQQQAILLIAAYAAAGDMDVLDGVLDQGLDAGLSISSAREVFTQLYAYAGFPRSLNALATLMQKVEMRKAQGYVDEPGPEPAHEIPKGDDLRATGTANQTQLVGQPVQGAIFDFAPAIGEYLQSHLFGAIFERDNLDWKHRELATVGMLSAIPGAEAQLKAHMGMSLNTGITNAQLEAAVKVLQSRADQAFATRASDALQQLLTSR